MVWDAGLLKNISIITSYKDTFNIAGEIINYFFENNVDIISVYALSNDNLSRDNLELMAVNKTLSYSTKNYLPVICDKWEAKFIPVGN